MAFRAAPRTVWGTRRWFLGREMVEVTLPEQTFEQFIFEKFHKGAGTIARPKPYSVSYSQKKGMYHQLPTDRATETMGATYRRAQAAGTTVRKEMQLSEGAKWSSRIYYLNQISRTIWWYAQESNVMENVFGDTFVPATMNMMMGVTTSLMGMIATATAIQTSITLGQPWMAVTAALSLPIQMETLFQGIEQTLKDERLRDYFNRRDKRLAEHTYGGP